MICYPPMGAKDLIGYLQIKDDLFVSQIFSKGRSHFATKIFNNPL
jgi:hypothetical protein